MAINDRRKKSISNKAVKPINVMGMTKAIQEKLITIVQSKRTQFSCVRYGNVIGSRGSVIPFFKQLIQKREPLTITDSRMTRFLITLPDAIDLVLKAVEFMQGGEIFVKKIPSAKMIDIAHVMNDMLADGECEITEVGIRPGEKIHEALLTEQEALHSVELNEYYVVLPEFFCRHPW